MRRRTLLLLVPLLLLGFGCSHDDDVVAPPEPAPPGAMTYAGYDENGAQVVAGWVLLDLAIIQVDPAVPLKITGTWKLRRVGFPGEIGPQVGEGTLEAVLDAEALFVDFNPGRADDNVLADGAFTVIGGPASGMRWQGTWRWTTLLGTRRQGTFSARG